MLETIITEVTFTEFSIWIFFHENSGFTGQQRKGDAISTCFTDTYTLAWRFPERETSPLHIAISRTQTKNHWFLGGSY